MTREEGIPFLGREQEMAVLKDLYILAENGTGSIALIIGEAGAGKTRLINVLSDWAASKGAAILNATCYEGATTVPFGPWVEAIRNYVTSVTPETIHRQLTDVAGEVMELIPELGVLLLKRRR